MKRKFPKYRDWIRTLPCAECSKIGPSECHHLKGDFHQSGAGMKAPDYLSMPLCSSCHSFLHDASDNWKETQREALIRTLIRAFEEGMIVVDGYQVHEPLPTRKMETK